MDEPWEKPPIMVGCCTSGLDADRGHVQEERASRVNLIERESHSHYSGWGQKVYIDKSKKSTLKKQCL